MFLSFVDSGVPPSCLRVAMLWRPLPSPEYGPKLAQESLLPLIDRTHQPYPPKAIWGRRSLSISNPSVRQTNKMKAAHGRHSVHQRKKIERDIHDVINLHDSHSSASCDVTSIYADPPTSLDHLQSSSLPVLPSKTHHSLRNPCTTKLISSIYMHVCFYLIIIWYNFINFYPVLFKNKTQILSL